MVSRKSTRSKRGGGDQDHMGATGLSRVKSHKSHKSGRSDNPDQANNGRRASVEEVLNQFRQGNRDA